MEVWCLNIEITSISKCRDWRCWSTTTSVSPLALLMSNLEVVMKTNMGRILGSAAGLLVAGMAQAADLPIKAKAVEYVRICSLYGAGFYYIPGTDTCIKLGGYLRIDTTFNGGIYDAPAWNGSLGAKDRFRDYFTTRSRGSLTVDTRTATEYGLVRAFFQGDFSFGTFNGGAGTNPAVVAANAGGVNVGG